jgi:hypothetical protein
MSILFLSMIIVFLVMAALSLLTNIEMMPTLTLVWLGLSVAFAAPVVMSYEVRIGCSVDAVSGIEVDANQLAGCYGMKSE